jgi:hypothetical protein
MVSDHHLRVIDWNELDDEFTVDLTVLLAPLPIFIEHNIVRDVNALGRRIGRPICHRNRFVAHKNHGFAPIVELSPCVLNMSHAPESAQSGELTACCWSIAHTTFCTRLPSMTLG